MFTFSTRPSSVIHVYAFYAMSLTRSQRIPVPRICSTISLYKITRHVTITSSQLHFLLFYFALSFHYESIVEKNNVYFFPKIYTHFFVLYLMSNLIPPRNCQYYNFNIGNCLFFALSLFLPKVFYATFNNKFVFKCCNNNICWHLYMFHP